MEVGKPKTRRQGTECLSSDCLVQGSVYKHKLMDPTEEAHPRDLEGNLERRDGGQNLQL
jgi:hypothetical protein